MKRKTRDSGLPKVLGQRAIAKPPDGDLTSHRFTLQAACCIGDLRHLFSVSRAVSVASLPASGRLHGLRLTLAEKRGRKADLAESLLVVIAPPSPSRCSPPSRLRLRHCRRTMPRTRQRMRTWYAMRFPMCCAHLHRLARAKAIRYACSHPPHLPRRWGSPGLWNAKMDLDRRR